MELQRANDASDGPAVVFLPGIIMPAEARYAPLVREFGDGIQAFTKELEVYAPRGPDDRYTLADEVEGLAFAADMRGTERFFLYGHSAGGAIAIAFASAHPERLLGLGLDEPASDFTAGTKAHWSKELGPISKLPASERLAAFMRAQVANGVELPAPPPGDPPAWMASRPAGVEAFITALSEHELEVSPPRFEGPVYYSLGTLSNSIWREISARLAAVYPNFTTSEFGGLHHLNTSHAAQPGRVASELRRAWSL